MELVAEAQAEAATASAVMDTEMAAEAAPVEHQMGARAEEAGVEVMAAEAVSDMAAQQHAPAGFELQDGANQAAVAAAAAAGAYVPPEQVVLDSASISDGITVGPLREYDAI